MPTVPDTGSLEGRVAIVTGGSQGSGLGAALALAKCGTKVMIAARTESRLLEAKRQIAANGGNVAFLAGDIMSQDDRDALVAQTIDRFGRLDILVNAAQTPDQRDARIDDISDDVISQLWESGFIATLKMMRLAKPHMIAAGGGSIINFGTGGQLKPENYGVYSAVKSAITTMTRAAAVEWAKENIRANVVMPLVRSPSSDLLKEQDPEGYAAAESHVPLGRFGDPEDDIGRVIAFLAGPGASYITGQTFVLNGGLSFLR